jgi:hypothetical protein
MTPLQQLSSMQSEASAAGDSPSEEPGLPCQPTPEDEQRIQWYLSHSFHEEQFEDLGATVAAASIAPLLSSPLPFLPCAPVPGCVPSGLTDARRLQTWQCWILTPSATSPKPDTWYSG